MLESLFNKFISLHDGNFTKKRLQHGRFPINIANFRNNYFEKHLRTAGSDTSYILHRKLNKIIQEVDWPSRLAFSHSLLLNVIFYYLLSFVVIRCHLLYHWLSLVVARCITRCHSLYYSMSFVVTRSHSLYHLLSFVVTRCHSMSLDLRLVSLFIKRSLFYNFLVFTSFIIKIKAKKYLV